MDFSQISTIVLNILYAVLLFNLMIVVHELGHFWAGRWRGMHIDRFQIWFGKPIWSKTYNGVKYGLGWLPFGGFVSLPQMAPMEAIEGRVSEEVKAMKQPTPLDKIIVAFAGPLFSFLLALTFGLLVWKVGKKEIQAEPVIGYVQAESHAADAGLKPGDRVLAVDGEEVKWWFGNMEGVTEKIMLTESKEVRFKVKRGDEILELTSEFKIPETKWYQRSGLPQVGVMNWSPAVVGNVFENSPAAIAGIVEGDEITHVDGEPIFHELSLIEATKSGKPLQLRWTTKGGEENTALVTPRVPDEGHDGLMLGIKGFKRSEKAIRQVVVHPTPWQQVSQSLNWMKITVQKVSSSKSNVGVDQLSGPLGILGVFVDLLSAEDGWILVLWFAVLLNVNLAVMNLLPIPVLDGGHISMALFEMVFRRPIPARVLETVQTFCALVLIGFMLFVTLKDAADRFGGEEKVTPKPVKFYPTASAAETDAEL